ncbi:arsenic efflux protein, partial [Aduncisulcus paluster]
MLLFQIDVNTLAIPHLGAYIGIAGTAISAALMIMGKKFLADDTHEEAEMKLMSLKETFIH